MTDNDYLCFCGSGKNYENCCNGINKQSVMAQTLKKLSFVPMEQK